MFDYLTRLIGYAAETIEEGTQRWVIQDRDDDERYGWIEQRADGSFSVSGTVHDAFAGDRYFALDNAGASYEEALVAWREVYASEGDPYHAYRYGAPSGVSWSGGNGPFGSRW